MTYYTWDASKNVSINESTQCNPFASYSVSDRALMTTGYIILFIFSLMGNVLVIAVFYKRYDQLRTPVNYFIVNMAASDLLVPLFVLPRSIKQVYLGWGTWLIGGVFGDILCRVVHFADEISMTVSSQSMVFIAVERFWSIVFPTKLPLITKQTAPRCIYFMWIFSSIIFSYYLFAHKLVDTAGTPYCDYGLPQIFDTWQDLWKADRLGVLAIFVACPFMLLIVLYTAIIVSLRRQEKIAIHLSLHAQQRRTKENQRITLMLVTVVAVFFISWTPYYVYFFHQYYSIGVVKLPCDSIKRLYLGGKYMNYIYTVINPLIYYTFNPIYRQGFHDMLRCPWSCPQACRRRRIHQEPFSHDSSNTNVESFHYPQEAEIELQVFD